MVRRGRGALAERLAREGLSLAEQTDSTNLRATTLLDAADVRRQAGRPDEAEPFEKRALRLFERRGATAQAAAIAGTGSVETAHPEPAPEPVPEPEQPIAAPEADPIDIAPEPAPTPDGGATRLADEMMALYASVDEPDPALEAQPEPPPVDPTLSPEELAQLSAEEESRRRWFTR
jgi:hypothetical protein